MASVKDIYLADKEIGYFPGWSKPERETGYIWFDAPLEIGGIAETGLVLHGGCYAHFPEVNVSFELRIGKMPGKQCIPIERLDWRSLEGGHSNPRNGKSEWSGIRVSESHIHDFWLGWSETEQRMKAGGLRTAIEFEQEIQSFVELLTYTGKRLRINNINIVSEPDWVYDLLNWEKPDGR